MILTPSSKTVLLWRVRASFCLLALCGLWLAFFDFSYLLCGLTSLVSLILYLFAVFFYIPRFFALYRVNISGNAVIIHSGVFFRKTKIFPFMRIIVTKTYRTPLSALLGLCGLVFCASRVKTVICEVEMNSARDFLSAVRGENDENKA